VDEQEDGRGLTMELKDSDVDPALLAGYSESKFVVRYSVKILDGSSLGLEMVVRNVGTVSLPPFSLAFHSYFRVAAASVEVRLNSTDVRFLDQLSGSEGVNAGGVVEGFGDREIDLVCYGVTNPIEIVTNNDDDEGGASANATTTVVTIDASDGLRDAVVWNPHVAKSKAMADFGDEEYREMVCVESARIETPVVVGAGGEWACSLRFRV
jgi:glucose-6-phosphate 1-epimerase